MTQIHDCNRIIISEVRERLSKSADVATSIESLLGIEGMAARVYFGRFAGMPSNGLPYPVFVFAGLALPSRPVVW